MSVSGLVRSAAVLALMVVVVFGATRPTLTTTVSGRVAGGPRGDRAAEVLSWALVAVGVTAVLVMLSVLRWRRRRHLDESIGYLSAADEARVLRQHRSDGTRPELRRLCEPADVLAMRASLDHVQAIDDLVGYIVALVDATRHHPKVAVGASPRGGIAVLQLARAHAVLAGRDFVLPEDVKAVAVPALAHRLALRPEMWVHRITGEDVITELLTRVPTPPTRQ